MSRDVTQLNNPAHWMLREVLADLETYKSALPSNDQGTFGGSVTTLREQTESLIEQFEAADAFARVADAYCWDPEKTTHDDLMNARAAWQTAVGQMKLRAASSPASRRDLAL